MTTASEVEAGGEISVRYTGFWERMIEMSPAATDFEERLRYNNNGFL